MSGKTVTVKMKANIAGVTAASSVGHYIGEVVELEPRIAQAWIEEGLCVPVREDAPVERAARA